VLIGFFWMAPAGKDDLQTDAWLAGVLQAAGWLLQISICENALTWLGN
jgi:hypothetical protein